MTVPNEAKSKLARAVVRDVGRGGRAVLTSGRECAAPGRGSRVAGVSRQAQRGARTARGETDIGGQRMTEAAAEASELCERFRS